MNAFASTLDKDAIKRALPLSYVCHRLGVNLNTDAYAICPFHADDRPSFHLFVGDDGLERWSCHPCKVTGDCFDLIQRMRGVGFTESVELARGLLGDLPENYAPTVVLHAPKLGPEDWGAEVTAAQQRAYDPRFAGRMSAWHHLEDDHDQSACSAMDEFLRLQFGWGIEETGAILMPHWTAQGLLTGCKLRGVDGFRWSKEGSKYEALYGAWLGKRSRAALLTEGETDCVWAAWRASCEGVEVDVYALPSGAGAEITAGMIQSLRGYATVYLALDPDGPGVDATREWLAALVEHGFADIRICRLPLGRDLREAKPSINRLLAAALAPQPFTGRAQVVQAGSNVGYGVQDANGNMRMISTWILEPVAQLEGGEDGPGLEIDIQNRGQATRDVIRWQSLTAVQQFKKWAADRSLIFSGNDKDLQSVAEYIQWRASFVPEVFQTDRVGMHDPPEAYRWSRRSVVFPHGYIGDMPWVYSPGPKKAEVSDNVLLPSDSQEPFEWHWLQAFLDLSDPSVTHPLLAWIVAASRRPEVTNFPLLFVGGPSGVGKSTIAKLSTRLLGSQIEAPLGSVTPYILMQRLASSTSLPVFVDEWTRLSRKDTREALQGLVPVVYEGGLAERGQSDLNVVRYRITSPVIIAGEDTLVLDRELERVVRIFPKHSWQNAEALKVAGRAPMERFGRLLHEFVITADLPPLVDQVYPTRPAHNEAVLRGGWQTLHLMLDQARLHDPGVPEIPVELPMPDASEYDSDENVYETAIREGASFRDTSGLPIAWRDPHGRGTIVRFATLIGVVERNLDIEMPGRGRAMMDYFRGKYGVEEVRARPLGAQQSVRAYLVHGFTLPSDDLEEVVEEPSPADHVAPV